MVKAAEPDLLELKSMLLACGAVKFGKFTLTSGQTSDVYVDIKQVWSHPARLRPIARRLARHIGKAEILAGMELGAVPLVVATSLETGVPYVVVRKPGRTHGTARTFEGHVPPGATCVVLEDVTTTGGSLVTTVEILRAAGAAVTHAVTVVDREGGGAAKLKAIGVELTALITLAELRGDPP
jgi:orotate phosphoribosyltransferase